jgi:hypothetical protein
MAPIACLPSDKGSTRVPLLSHALRLPSCDASTGELAGNDACRKGLCMPKVLTAPARTPGAMMSNDGAVRTAAVEVLRMR